jgi:asparagine synthase (glutamine-hydrolysing)
VCGFTGFLDASRHLSSDARIPLVAAMARRIEHRGPDDAGEWSDEATGLTFGFRRLSILDLSPLGHQPMSSPDGRFIIIFNGEIYNFAELRAELETHGHEFRGGSDTEVMLAAFAEWGVETSLRRFNGMFAFALFDRQSRTLTLARDRIGKKPLYYGWSGGTFFFGSELKSFFGHPDFRPSVDRDALALYMRFMYVPAPHSIYDGIRKLPSASFGTMQLGEGQRDLDIRPYWSMREAVEKAAADPFTGSETEALDALDALLSDAVRLRMISDVPLGAFLSGGIDSPTVVALMQKQSTTPVRTFSIGFQERDYNEADHAKRIAEHLGTAHTEMYVSPAEALDVVPHLSFIFDEPFADSSQIPTYLVSKLARQHVTVAVSGDGGDEFFGGYNRYFWGRKLARVVSGVPRSVRRGAARAATSIRRDQWDRLFAALRPVLPARARHRSPGIKIFKAARMVSATSPEAMYQALMSSWAETNPVIGAREELFDRAWDWPHASDLPSRLMYVDAVGYLVDDIMAKVDRASMAVSLEARAPILDYRVVELAWRLPLSMKIRGNEGKVILRRLLDRYVPRDLVDRPKVGFSIPLDEWLRGPLRDWAESLLAPERLRAEGYLEVEPVRRVWTEHLEGRGNWQYELWTVLMFQAWLDAWRGAA